MYLQNINQSASAYLLCQLEHSLIRPKCASSDVHRNVNWIILLNLKKIMITCFEAKFKQKGLTRYPHSGKNVHFLDFLMHLVLRETYLIGR